MTDPPTTHTIDEALERFHLIGNSGGDADKGTASVMTALSWVAGEAWTDHPRCAHPVLANLAIRTNDHPDTTEAERIAVLRAGETGLMDTWWLPGEVVAWCVAEGIKASEAPVGRCMATLAAVTAWKDEKERVDLTGANLAYANLADANLADANLTDANLAGANLAYANLADANLADANLAGANLAYANLADAYLADANLADANLTGANLADANLTDANLADAYLAYANLADANLADANLASAHRADANLADANLTGANLADANLTDANLADAYLAYANLADANLADANLADARCSKYTVPPAGWTVNTTTWRLEREESA